MGQTNGFQVIKKLGPVICRVEVAHSQVLKQHIDQLKPREDSPQVNGSPDVAQADAPVLDNFQYPPVEELPAPQNSPESSQTPARCYPQRQRRPPNRFMAASEH